MANIRRVSNYLNGDDANSANKNQRSTKKKNISAMSVLIGSVGGVDAVGVFRNVIAAAYPSRVD